MTNSEHLADRRVKALRCYFGLSAVGIRSNQLRHPIKTALYRACCRPVIAYGTENLALTDTDLRKAQRVEGNAVKTMLSIPKFASTTRLLDALRIEPVSELVQRSKLTLFAGLTENGYTKCIIEASTKCIDRPI